MKIHVKDNWSIVEDAVHNMPAVAIIRQICRARPSGYQFMPRYRSGKWDGYISLMNGMSKFPTGLLPEVKRALTAKNIAVTLVYSNPALPITLPSENDLKGITLRDYQLDAVNVLLKSTRGIAKMATNSGKTEVMAELIYALGFPKTLVVLHRKELLYQTAKRFTDRLGSKRLGNVGMIGDGLWGIGKIVTIAMIQMLHSHKHCLEAFADTKLVMIDECHNASSNSFMDIMNDIPGPYRYGFSGTPLKYDVLSDLRLVSLTGPVKVDISNDYLIENGYSATPIVYAYEMPDDDVSWDEKWQIAYTDCIVENATRNNRIVELAKKSATRGSVLIIVNRVAHGKRLVELAKSQGLHITFVNGSDSTDLRKKTIANMAINGVYCATPIFDEGVDIPAIHSLILAAGGKSYVKLLQRIGRGLRYKDGDNKLVVYDFIDTSNKHLQNHSDERLRTYEDEGFEVKTISSSGI